MSGEERSGFEKEYWSGVRISYRSEKIEEYILAWNDHRRYEKRDNIHIIESVCVLEIDIERDIFTGVM